MDIKCSVCGCNKYTKHGNTTGGKWVFRCSNGHTWAAGSINEAFPWREDDYFHPKNYSRNTRGDYVRIPDSALAIIALKDKDNG